MDLILEKGPGQTVGFAEDLIEKSGLNPKKAIEDAKKAVTDLDTNSSDFKEMKKAFSKNDSWKTAAEKLTGKKEGGNRTGGIFTKEALDNLKSRKPKGTPTGVTYFKNTDKIFRTAIASLSPHEAGASAGVSGSPRSRPRVVTTDSSDAIDVLTPRQMFTSMAAFDDDGSNCPKGSPKGITDVYIAKGVELAAHSVMEGFPTDGLTIAARIAPIAVKTAASAAVLVLEGLNDVSGDCHDDFFKDGVNSRLDAEESFTSDAELGAMKTGVEAHVTTSVNSAQTAIVSNDNSNKKTIVDNDNANAEAINKNIDEAQTSIIANDNANRDEMKNLLLRLQIEADLASVDGATPVALFVTPRGSCTPNPNTPLGQCGLLEFVRSIVAQTIVNLAGSSSATANSFLAKGDDHKTTGNYKAAYQQYRLAYKAAAGMSSR